MNNGLNIKTNLLENREFLNINDLMETLGTSQNTIYRMCDRKELNKYKQVGRGLGITEGRIKSGQPKIYDYDVTKIKTMPPPPPKAINKTLNV